MKLFKKLFGKPDIPPLPAAQPENMASHCVSIYFKYGRKDMEAFYDMEDKLAKVIDESQTGQYDWHEMAEDYTEGSMSMYGPDADALFKIIKPVLEMTDFMQGATAILRYGEEGDDTRELTLTITNN